MNYDFLLNHLLLQKPSQSLDEDGVGAIVARLFSIFYIITRPDGEVKAELKAMAVPWVLNSLTEEWDIEEHKEQVKVTLDKFFRENEDIVAVAPVRDIPEPYKDTLSFVG